MDSDQIFITTLTEKTGITYETIMRVYMESGLRNREDLRDHFMERFQMSMGFASTLTDIVMTKGQRH